ncbi:MAG: regulatory protein RecX, partial [Calditrichia bacterium]
KMREKGYRFPVINRALDEMEKLELVDDVNFTRLFIQNELLLRPVSRLLLVQKLAQRGVSRDISDPLLNELFPPELELEIARKLTRKFLKSNARYESKKRREKLIRYLQGKGFTWEHISQVSDFHSED